MSICSKKVLHPRNRVFTPFFKCKTFFQFFSVDFFY
nr:MAG TPA: hypothetical protein [Caudoviricetes sp.]